MIRITSITLANGQVSIKFERRSTGGRWDKNSTTCSELPSAAFEQAVQALDAGALELLELPSTELASLDVEGVAVKYGRGLGTWSAKIVGSRSLQRSDNPMHFATPMKHVNRSNRAGDRVIFSVELTRQLVEVFGFAERYLQGEERSQMSLFDQAPDDQPSTGLSPLNPIPRRPAEPDQPSDADTEHPADDSVPELGDTYDYLFGGEDDGKPEP